jgi:hypothetical protein
VLCVCSDETVGKREEDEFIRSVSDLAFPVTSDAKEIRKFIQANKSFVIFCTYQSSPMVADAQDGDSSLAFDLVVADEAHRCTGNISSTFSTVLDSNRIIANKRLFATATPRTYTESIKRASEDRGIEMACMDDETIFGKVLYSLSFGEAIRQNLLTDYRIVIIGVDNPMIAEWIENRVFFKTDSGLKNDAESIAAQIGLIKAIKDYDLKRIISFHSRVNRAQSFKEDMHQTLNWIDDRYRPSGELWTDFVSGGMATDLRKQKLDFLKSLDHNQRGLLTNARCLSEGVDVPSLDGVAFIDPKNSQVDIVQAVGRAIRLSEDKKIGTIILPVFIEPGDDAITSIEASNFRAVWEVLNAFKSHDNELSDQLDLMRVELGLRPNSKLKAKDLPKIMFDLPSTLDSTFGDSLRTYLVEKTTSSWCNWYGILKQFVEEYGNAKVFKNYITREGMKLGSWVSSQRGFKSKNLLSQEKIERLEALPGWTWNARVDSWEDAYEQLETYVKENGDAKVPQSYITPQGLNLGNWVGMQRGFKSKNNLNSDRLELLESLPGWSWNARRDKWEYCFEKLSEYIQKNGNAKVPFDHITMDGTKLGVWVTGLRQRKLRNALSSFLIERLESLPGWSWDIYADKWEEGFQRYQYFVNEKGSAKIAQQYVNSDGFPIGNWVNAQRQSKLKNGLNLKQIERLESLPGWTWNARADNWEDAYEQLQSYAELHGNTKVKRDYVTENGIKLEQWIKQQRGFKSRNELSQDKIERLETLPGWSWDVYSDKWRDAYEQLETYVKENGDAKVPKSYITPQGLNLGNWVGMQRGFKSKNNLNSDRLELLESLPGWSWDPFTDQWEANFKQLQSFVDEYGHAKVPHVFINQYGQKLGVWVLKQRQNKAKNKLTPEREKRLEGLSGWTWMKK